MNEIPSIPVGKTLQESQPHGDDFFPVDIHTNFFPSSKNNEPPYHVPCHWHPEVEILLVAKGTLHYQVNLTEYTISPGEAIFVNSNQLHSGFPINRKDAQYHTVIFHPDFLCANENSLVYRNYLLPLLKNHAFPSFHLKPDTQEKKTCLQLISTCYELYQKQPAGWELELLSCLTGCWKILWNISCRKASLIPLTRKASRDQQNIRLFLDYVTEHYAEKLTLADLSAAVSLSPGECERLCRRVLHQSPVDYLLSYRIYRSIPLLVKHELSITEIALQSGFSGSSYYAEIFRRIKGVSPREFRSRLIKY